MRFDRQILSMFLALFSVVGCSRPDMVHVSGDVAWESVPVPHGDVLFIDVDPHIAPQGAKIVEGKFDLQCKPGQKRVEIMSFRLGDKKTPEGKPIGEMYIPERYNVNSTLTANVTLDGENYFTFNLEP